MKTVTKNYWINRDIYYALFEVSKKYPSGGHCYLDMVSFYTSKQSNSQVKMTMSFEIDRQVTISESEFDKKFEPFSFYGSKFSENRAYQIIKENLFGDKV